MCHVCALVGKYFYDEHSENDCLQNWIGRNDHPLLSSLVEKELQYFCNYSTKIMPKNHDTI